ncbi:MAG: hypothetical protein OEZ34_16530, partial [Spirochaetia bacterium]|nr:hypothetical protein [Spirochaetia bacterium]
MKNKILTFLGSFTGLAVIIILLSLGACISGPTYKNHDFILKDLNYIDNTFAFQLKLPNPTWKIKGELRRFADGHFIAEVTKNGTNLYLYVVISRHHQDSLEKFASAGSFDPTQSNFTFIAGKPAYFYGKNQSASNNQLRVEVYKFVNDNKGYIISLAYPVGLSADNATMEELDELLNSFM